MSQQALADACAKQGVPMSRSMLANLEGGRRDVVSVDELLAFAQALDCHPSELLPALALREHRHAGGLMERALRAILE